MQYNSSSDYPDCWPVCVNQVTCKFMPKFSLVLWMLQHHKPCKRSCRCCWVTLQKQAGKGCGPCGSEAMPHACCQRGTKLPPVPPFRLHLPRAELTLSGQMRWASKWSGGKVMVSPRITAAPVAYVCTGIQRFADLHVHVSTRFAHPVTSFRADGSMHTMFSNKNASIVKGSWKWLNKCPKTAIIGFWVTLRFRNWASRNEWWALSLLSLFVYRILLPGVHQIRSL